jgi:hypothetical protein
MHGWMLAGCRLDAGWMPAGCWLDAGGMQAACWLDADEMLAGCIKLDGNLQILIEIKPDCESRVHLIH